MLYINVNDIEFEREKKHNTNVGTLCISFISHWIRTLSIAYLCSILMRISFCTNAKICFFVLIFLMTHLIYTSGKSIYVRSVFSQCQRQNQKKKKKRAERNGAATTKATITAATTEIKSVTNLVYEWVMVPVVCLFLLVPLSLLNSHTHAHTHAHKHTLCVLTLTLLYSLFNYREQELNLLDIHVHKNRNTKQYIFQLSIHVSLFIFFLKWRVKQHWSNWHEFSLISWIHMFLLFLLHFKCWCSIEKLYGNGAHWSNKFRCFFFVEFFLFPLNNWQFVEKCFT